MFKMIGRVLVSSCAIIIVSVYSWPVSAKISTSIEGVSNDQGLYAWKGPTSIDSTNRISQSAGSISSAVARGVFHKYKITIGNQVISAGTNGDNDYTHVRAGSLFYGKAKFIGAQHNQKVKNFKIVYHLEGDLSCVVADPTVPEGYALSSVETQVRFNGTDRFVGTGTVDGIGGFDGGTGRLAGQFNNTEPYSASIDKNFKVNLGTVRDGQVYPMLFFGATLVSYAADIPVDECAADFLKTAEFTVDDDVATNKGQFKFQSAKVVHGSANPNPYSLSQYPDVTVYLENSDETFLNDIDINTIQLFERLGDNGQLQPKTMHDIGDDDSDGVPDRGIVFDGLTFYQLLGIALVGYEDTLTLYLIGDTTDGTPFVSTLVVETEV
ncbi:MAG: hypothetical protein HYV33_02535 [Candidatus Kerfeldbacteria bacterium]|nr:hypothetical protein [Candidatus Kerfeldbacteria bacterium]